MDYWLLGLIILVGTISVIELAVYVLTYSDRRDLKETGRRFEVWVDAYGKAETSEEIMDVVKLHQKDIEDRKRLQ